MLSRLYNFFHRFYHHGNALQKLQELPIHMNSVKQREDNHICFSLNSTCFSSAFPSLGSFTASSLSRFHLCYMVPDLSPPSLEIFILEPAAVLLLGNIFSVGVTAGLPTPEELELLERCCVGGGRTGLMGGGRS